FIKISARFAQPTSRIGPPSAIRAVVAFAHDTGAEVIAEGLEADAHVELARSLGVTLGQGYVLGRPAAQWTEVEVTGSRLAPGHQVAMGRRAGSRSARARG